MHQSGLAWSRDAAGLTSEKGAVARARVVNGDDRWKVTMLSCCWTSGMVLIMLSDYAEPGILQARGEEENWTLSILS